MQAKQVYVMKLEWSFHISDVRLMKPDSESARMPGQDSLSSASIGTLGCSDEFPTSSLNHVHGLSRHSSAIEDAEQAAHLLNTNV